MEGTTFNPAIIVSVTTAIVTGIGAGIYGLKKNGFITFGKAKERRNCAGTCAEHHHVVAGIQNLEKNQEHLMEKVDEVVGEVRFIAGYIKGQHGNDV